MIYDLFKISDDSDLELKLKNDNVQAFDAKCDEVVSTDTDSPTDSTLESLYKEQIEKSEELIHLLQVYAQDTAFGDNKYDYCRSK